VKTTISLADLKAADACEEQRDEFARLFGTNPVEVTEELCLAHAAVFDWAWAARCLLTALARAEYDKATATAWAEYKKVRASAWAEYEKARATAWAEYEKARATTLAEYHKARASAFARCVHTYGIKEW
jgi:hypothetical protein